MVQSWYSSLKCREKPLCKDNYTMTVKSESGCQRERPQTSAFFFIDMLFPSSRQGKWNPWNICRSGSQVARNRVPRNCKHGTSFRKESYGIWLNPMTSWTGKYADSINASYSVLRIPQNRNFAFQICLHGCQTERMKICRDKGWKSRIFFAASNAGTFPPVMILLARIWL